MNDTDRAGCVERQGDGAFTITHWSVDLAAGQAASPRLKRRWQRYAELIGGRYTLSFDGRATVPMMRRI